MKVKTLPVKILDNRAVADENETGACLVYATPQSAGADIRAMLDEPVTIEHGEHRLFPSGLAVAIPEGFEIQVRPRSGLAYKHGVTVLNSPGTIDSDYRGDVGVILINHGKEPFEVTHGMRIAQLVMAPVVQAQTQIVDDLDDTERGDGGFGSSGKH